MINIDLDCYKVNEALEKRKKKKYSKVQVPENTLGESSARTKGIKDSLAAVEVAPTMANYDGVVPSHSHASVTPI